MTSLVNRILCRVSLGLITAAAVTTAAAQHSEIGPTTDAQVQSQNKTKIALIVSPKGSVLSEAAAPIQQGILAASREATASGACELIQYELSSPQDAGAVLKKAADDGAVLAIGPVSRDAVQTISEMPYLPLPVVAINRPSGETAPELFLSIDISAESEVDQLAKIAVENTAQKTDLAANNFVILTTQDPYDERLARAMEAALIKAGAGAERRHISSDQIAYLRQEMRGKAFRGVFFAMNAQNASLLRPYLPPELPVFGTSYTNPMHQKDSMLAKTQANDLNGMITLEIPSTLVAQYKGDRENLSPEDLQMFSVGVDAWQLGTKWIDWARRIEVPNGLTGRLSFDKDNGSKVKRELVKTVVSPNKTGKTSEEDLVQFTESAEEAGL